MRFILAGIRYSAHQILSLLRFEYAWLFPPIAIFALYGIQSVYDSIFSMNSAAWRMLQILTVGCVAYLLGFYFLRRLTFRPLLPLFSGVRIRDDLWISGIISVYALLIIYALATTPKIALIEALHGASAEDIAYAREMLFKTRVGWERALSYFNATLTSALIPYALTVSYLERKKYRHALLIFFVLSLLPSLEKALVIKAFFPLIIVAINRYLPRRLGLIFFAAMVGVIFSVTKLTKIGPIDSGVQITHAEQATRPAQINNPTKTERELSRFEILDTSSPFNFLINRVAWIPYITARDWIFYFEDALSGKFLNGRTSTLFSLLSGQDRFDMGREVFAFEYGSGGLQTGSANALFLVDAYVNFSWLGVIIFSLIIAFFIRLLELSGNPAAHAVFYYYIYHLIVGPLFGVMFSNGLLLFMLLVFLTSPTKKYGLERCGF